MGRGHSNTKRDANHNEIIEQLQSCGLKIVDLYRVGNDCPDILVGGIARGNSIYRGPVNVLVEIKTETGTCTKGQKKFLSTWPGPCLVARDADTVLQFFGIL